MLFWVVTPTFHIEKYDSNSQIWIGELELLMAVEVMVKRSPEDPCAVHLIEMAAERIVEHHEYYPSSFQVHTTCPNQLPLASACHRLPPLATACHCLPPPATARHRPPSPTTTRPPPSPLSLPETASTALSPPVTACHLTG